MFILLPILKGVPLSDGSIWITNIMKKDRHSRLPFYLYSFNAMITILGSDPLSGSGSFPFHHLESATGNRVPERHDYNRTVR